MAKRNSRGKSSKGTVGGGEEDRKLGGGYADFDHSGFFNDSDEELQDIEVTDKIEPPLVLLGEVGSLSAPGAVTVPTLMADQQPLQVRITASDTSEPPRTYNDFTFLANGKFCSSVTFEVRKIDGILNGRIWYTSSKSGNFRDVVRRTPFKPFA